MEYIYEYFLEIVECKFARNSLTNVNIFLTNILKNINWHLFAGESHQVVKITVTYSTRLTLRAISRRTEECWKSRAMQRLVCFATISFISRFATAFPAVSARVSNDRLSTGTEHNAPCRGCRWIRFCIGSSDPDSGAMKLFKTYK
jgi:hypothetical protein